MKKFDELKSLPITVIVLISGFGVYVFYLLCLWTDNNLEFWFSHFKGSYVDIPNWLSVVITLVLNGVAVVFNIICELAKFII